MKIIICGAGQVGGQIARHLAREEGANHVTVIDRDAALIRRITDTYDVTGIAAHPPTSTPSTRTSTGRTTCRSTW